MPQDVEFHLSFPVSLSPDLPGVRQRNLAWVRRTGLVVEGRSLEWYASWDMPQRAALGFPYAEGAALDLCAEAMALFFDFDDRFDGCLARDPARIAAVCRRMTGIVHGGRPGTDPCSVAFADIRARGTEGAPRGWVPRCAHEW